MNTKSTHLETLAIHAGQTPDPTTGAISVPVYLTSTYVQSGPGEHKGYEYSRSQNPTRQALEGNLAALEGGRYGLAFASGCAATTTILHMLRSGDHVVAGDDLDGGT
jgi:cystathionine gamma-lyase